MPRLECMLNDVEVARMTHEWLQQDIPSFDVAGAVVGDAMVEATVLAKSTLVLAGQPFATALLRRLGCDVTWCVAEGVCVRASSQQRVAVAHVRGPAHAVLQAERTVLEILSRASACASETRRCVRAAHARHRDWRGRVACTRKTTPGLFRQVEKYGVLVGGGDPHRYSLSSMVMLKDNHIDIAGSITRAVQAARAVGGFSVMIEVECRSIADAEEACRAGANVVMLDNFTAAQVAQAVPVLRASHPHVCIECSGGITYDTIADYAIDGVDVISIGKLTHGPPPVDISMKIKKTTTSTTAALRAASHL